MEGRIKEIIKRTFPTNKYEEMDLALLDKYAEFKSVQLIIKEINALTDVTTLFEKASDYFHSHRIILVDIPVDVYTKIMYEERDVDDYPAIFQDKQCLITMSLCISQLGPFYKYYWNKRGILGEAVNREQVVSGHDDFLPDAPDEFWLRVETEVGQILKKYGFQFFSAPVLQEDVAWIEPGDSLIEGNVTVDHCLFQEV